MFYDRICRLNRIFTLSLIALLAPAMCSLEARRCVERAPGAVDYHPAVTAFFESKDPFVQQVVLPNIEANRKSDAALEIVTADGQPMAGAGVGQPERHAFLFVIATCDGTRSGKPELLNQVFHFTCPGNVCKWRSFAKTPIENDFSKSTPCWTSARNATSPSSGTSSADIIRAGSTRSVRSARRPVFRSRMQGPAPSAMTTACGSSK